MCAYSWLTADICLTQLHAAAVVVRKKLGGVCSVCTWVELPARKCVEEKLKVTGTPEKKLSSAERGVTTWANGHERSKGRTEK